MVGTNAIIPFERKGNAFVFNAAFNCNSVPNSEVKQVWYCLESKPAFSTHFMNKRMALFRQVDDMNSLQADNSKDE